MKLYGDLELANIIEEASARDDSKYVEAMSKLFPNEGYDTFKFEYGGSCYVGNSPFTNTHGFGTSDIHDSKLLNEIENYFSEKNCPTVLSVCSVVSNKIIQLLFDNNYSTLCYRNVYIYNSDKGLKHNSAVEVREVIESTDKEIWLKVVSDGFAGKALEKPDLISLGQSVKEGNKLFVAFIEGEPVGASALYLDGNVARLGGMATLVDYRGKGVQGSMIQHRTNLAHQLGCEIIFSDTQPGNNSQRNLERNNYKLAYVRSILRKR